MADHDPRIEFQADGLRLRGAFLLPAEQGPHPGLILCHGLPRGLPPTPGEPGYPELTKRFCTSGFAVLFFNFRGTGESQGNFDILGWARDLKAAVDYLWRRTEVDRAHLYVLGSSAGGAIAIYGAARDQRLAGVVTWAAPAHWRPLGDAAGFLEHARNIGIIRDPSYPPSVYE
ncbi:MAG: alpha/beta fold hydrolase [Chloroflexi bacterium]|nr:alpha/beta fold hydrolase [Chloroflexota bacterium]